MRARWYFALFGITLAAATAAAQISSTSSDTKSASASAIRLDIHATVDAAPVQDLTAADLSIVEDGTPQKIENLRHASNPARSFVVFLDTPHMRFEGARNVRVALVRFLDRLLDDDDVVGVMTPDLAAADIEFGTKAAVIPRIMQDEALWERARVGSRDPKEDRYAQCFPANQYRGIAAEMQERHREQATLDALAGLTDFLSGSRQDRTAVITLTDGWRLFGPNPRLGGVVSTNRGGFGGFGGGGRGRGGLPGGGGFPRGGTQGDDGGRDVSAASRTECEADRMALAALDDSLRLDRIADAANRAVTSFYTVYARVIAAEQTPNGKPPAVVGDQEQDPASRMDAMRQLALNTDGMPVMTSAALDGAVERINSDMTSYDVVTYRSTNNRLDGKFRSVTVRALRPAVTIRTRRGYRAAGVDDVLGTGTSSTGSAFGTVAAVTPRANFRIRTATARPGDAPTAVVWVVGELDYRARREVTWTAGGTADVTDRQSVHRAVSDIETHLSSVDVLVNNAGSMSAIGPIWEVDPDDWWTDVQTSLLGAFVCCRALVPGMIERRRGRVVNLTSYVAVRPSPYLSGYAAAKAGLASLTEALAASLEPYGVCAFAVAPGFTDTELTRAARQSNAGAQWLPGFGEGRVVGADRSAALITWLAEGFGDALNGRFLHTLDDVESIVERIDEVRQKELYAPRIRRLD